ncbi:MAG: helix-turn-helix transcriptional regulator [Candidatus Eisenbacteria bacterium]|nr:helix-turn-helix transcriptional regulator [Candidatus Eisenbacteria bacterium]
MSGNIKFVAKASHAWLRRMAEAEADCESVAVAGLAHRAGIIAPATAVARRALGRLIEFARRSTLKTLAELAQEADVDLAEVYALETGKEDFVPSPRTVIQLAGALNVPVGRLLELAGLAASHDPTLDAATLRFVADAEPCAPLSTQERAAYEEFVQALTKTSGRGSGIE